LYALWIPSTVDNTSTCTDEPAIAHDPKHNQPLIYQAHSQFIYYV